MRNGNYYVSTLHNGQSWEVFCNRCTHSIGTMTGDAILKAILSTAKKGGILCPECRKASCPRCGVQILDKGEVNGQFCMACEMELAEDNATARMDCLECGTPFLESRKGVELCIECEATERPL